MCSSDLEFVMSSLPTLTSMRLLKWSGVNLDSVLLSTQMIKPRLENQNTPNILIVWTISVLRSEQLHEK